MSGIISKPASQAYRDNFDRVFRRRRRLQPRRLSCVHGDGFGTSVACGKCNAELAALVDYPRRFGSR